MAEGAGAAGGAAPIEDGDRLVTLDFIRGIAVLGILFANIVGFAHPQLAYSWPREVPGGLDASGKALWLVQYLLIDGKMRGLFSLLFGAGMALFMQRAWAQGHTLWLQVRRLVWLGVFGVAHFFLLFWGDILLLYAMSGLAALPMLAMRKRALLGFGIVWYVSGAIFLALGHLSGVTLEQSGDLQPPTLVAQEQQRAAWATLEEDAAQERAVFLKGDYGAELAFIAQRRAPQLRDYPLIAAFETIPLMLIGMALYRFGFFGGGFPVAAMRRWGWTGILVGLGLSLPPGLWAISRGFPPFLTDFVFNGAPQLPRLPMILGLAALLSIAAPGALAAKGLGGRLARRLAAAGRMAFSNYIGTSFVMMLIFRSWALGYYGRLDRIELLAPMVLGWLAMLAWSRPWLAHFRYGPLEWVWRCLTYWRVFPFKA